MFNKKAKQIAALQGRADTLETSVNDLLSAVNKLNDSTGRLLDRTTLVEQIANHTDKELLRTQTTTKQISTDMDAHRQFTHNQDEALRLHSGVVSEIKVGLYELGQKVGALANALSMEFTAGPNGPTAKKVKKAKVEKTPDAPVPTMASFMSSGLEDKLMGILNQEPEPEDQPDPEIVALINHMAGKPAKKKPAKKKASPPKKAKARARKPVVKGRK